MKIDLERIDHLPPYVIVNGKAAPLLVEAINTLEDYADVEINKMRDDEKVGGRRYTAEQLADALKSAQSIGMKGEEFVNEYLNQKYRATQKVKIVWMSKDNAIAPYDFSVEHNGSKIYIDAKSTMGDFDTPIHISYNELLEMKKRENQYQIFRIYKINDDEAQLRKAENINGFSEKILRVFENLPWGVRADGINLTPNLLSFDEEITVCRAKTKKLIL